MPHTFDLGGKTFTVTPTTADDHRELFPGFRRLTGKEFPTGPEIGAALRTLDGARLVIAHKLRQADPTVTDEWVAAAVPDMGTAHDLYAELYRAHTAAH